MSKSVASSSAAAALAFTIAASLSIGATSTAGCAKTGMGAAVRGDVSTRMETAQPSFTSCYAAALKRSRKVRGMLVLSITAAANSGEFKNITVSRDETGDPQMKQCVIDEVAKLKLEKPQKTNITFNYPLRFDPTK
jgi:hypothetical protein